MHDILTIKDALNRSAEFLKTRGSSSPRLDAELLLGRVLNLPRLQLYLQFDRPLMEVEKEQYREMLRRRGRHEPVAYILGEKEFMALPFFVNPSVLIPRPDTEILVEQAGRRIRAFIGEKGRPPAVFEIGVGSGAISVALLTMFADLTITAGDISAEALAVAGRNAERHGVSSRLELLSGDLFAGAPGPFDMIISNPPYIGENARAGLSPDILEYEPAAALFAGPDGLDVLLRILEEGSKKLSDAGWILLEIGSDQLPHLKSPIEKFFSNFEAVKDYAGLVRVLCIRR